MQKQIKVLFARFYRWRYKNISNKTFVHIMSVAVGLLAGLAAVTLKNTLTLSNRLLKKESHSQAPNSISSALLSA